MKLKRPGIEQKAFDNINLIVDRNNLFPCPYFNKQFDVYMSIKKSNKERSLSKKTNQFLSTVEKIPDLKTGIRQQNRNF